MREDGEEEEEEDEVEEKEEDRKNTTTSGKAAAQREDGGQWEARPKTAGSDVEALYEEFDLQGMTKEEVIAINESAPVGQRLEDALAETRELEKKMHVDHNASASPADKEPVTSLLQAEGTTFQEELENFIREHPFTTLLNSNLPFRTSQRRSFERDLYDFVRSYGHDSIAAYGVIWQVKSQWQPGRIDSGTEWEGEVLNQRRHTVNLPDMAKKTSNAKARSDKNIRQARLPDLNLDALSKNISKLGEALLRPLSVQHQAEDSSRPQKQRKQKQRGSHGITSDQEIEVKAISQDEDKTKRKADEVTAASRKARKKAKRDRRATARKQTNEQRDSLMQQKNGGVEEQQHRPQEQIAKIDALIGDIRDYSNAKQVQIFENGGMNDAHKEVKDELKDMKSQRDYINDANKTTKLKRKRTSGSTTSNHAIIEAREQVHPHSQRDIKTKKRRLSHRNNINGEQTNQSNSTIERRDFRLPMKQQA